MSAKIAVHGIESSRVRHATTVKGDAFAYVEVRGEGVLISLYFDTAEDVRKWAQDLADAAAAEVAA